MNLLLQFHSFALSFVLTLSFHLLVHASERTWHSIHELSSQERKSLVLTTQHPHVPHRPNLPVEKFLFAAPYSAEEMGIRALEFPHTPLWNCLLIDIGITVTPEGFLDQQVGMSAVLALPQSDSPGQEAFRWISQSVNSQDPADTAITQVGYHTGKNNDVALTIFFPRPGLPPLRSSISRGERLPRGIGTIDDVVGRNAGDYTWRILGSDILERTLRFPTTQKQLVVPDTEGKAVTISTQTVKIMGTEYPGYAANGAVPCYVVEAVPRTEALPNYYLSKLVYWLDQSSFFPLRIEQYDRTGKLMFITVRTASHANPQLKERGYAGFLELSWDLPRDMMTSSIHTVIPKNWSEEERQLFFHPESVQWKWPFPALARFPRMTEAKEFYLRPDLYSEKFPQDHKIELSPELTARITAQEREGHLVFRHDTEER